MMQPEDSPPHATKPSIHKRKRSRSWSDDDDEDHSAGAVKRPQNDTTVATSAGSPSNSAPVKMDISPTTPASASSLVPEYPESHQPRWQKTIEKAVPAIVSIRFSQVSAFDTEGPDTSEASGFVVDAKNGIILTNRHVTCAGPFVGEAVFHDHEEVDVTPIYRDPIHDFGFLRFDPSKIRYMPVTEVPLAPHLAKVGLDIRVVGNDAGEKLSILAGSISRLDRNAPDYGEMTYNDFNTFYLQAASSTSGGSSGSPVLDINGNAVALQAGGHTKAATDFFFPLDRVKRALQFVRQRKPVPRGTVQVQFYHRPFDEVRRLGLRLSTESNIRSLFPEEIGMLVAETVVPEGPASKFLEEGDVLVEVNGNVVTGFVKLEDVLDSSVGGTVKFKIERGGQEMEFEIQVQDLHSITPDRYVEVGGAKVNNLSYQLARQFCVPVKGVYVTEPAGMFRLDGGSEHGWIISSIDTKPTPNLDAFIAAIQTLHDRERVPVTYYSIADVHTISVAIVNVERHWTGFRMAVRNDTTGLWDFTDLGAPLPPKPLKPATATFAELDDSLGAAKALFHSIVKVTFYMPARIDGFPKSRKQGAGLILDAEKGLVVVGRNIIPYSLGDVSITVADSCIIPAKVEFLHPTQNITFIRYDPKLLGSTPVRSAVLSDVELNQGHKVTLAALNHNQRPVCIETIVTDITSVTIPQSATPRFRAINFDAITLDTPLAQQCSSGVLADCEGRVQGLWLSFLGERTNSGHDNEYHLGVHIGTVLNILDRLRKGQSPVLRGLAVEVMPVQISQSRHMGLSDEWVKKVELANPQRRQLFLVRRTETGTATAGVLKELDLILAVEGKTITRVHELDFDVSDEDDKKVDGSMNGDAAHKECHGKTNGSAAVVETPSASPSRRRHVGVSGVRWGKEVEVTILRQKVEMTLKVPTTELDGEGTKRFVVWAGAVIQEPHRAVLQQSKHLPSQVYVCARAKGSPAYMYGMVPTQWVTQINGKPTRTLDEFMDAVKDLPDNEYSSISTGVLRDRQSMKKSDPPLTSDLGFNPFCSQI
ncbi:hypothetical protein HK102_013689 [Quaeritorhiza haematococci]|nr:hypothetical protein HK102_013689 [Quaeritorhiza haematococci]